jgi:hypothetical protein
MEGLQSLSAWMVRVKAFLVIKYKVFSNLNGKYFSSFEAHKTAESWPVTTSPMLLFIGWKPSCGRRFYGAIGGLAQAVRPPLPQLGDVRSIASGSEY